MLEIEARRWALVVGHPGHELRAFHFCERARPSLAVITDGSGSHGIPRIAETRQLAEELGVSPSAVFGVLTDRKAYALLQSGDRAALMQIVDTLARAFVVTGSRPYWPTRALDDAAFGRKLAAVQRYGSLAPDHAT